MSFNFKQTALAAASVASIGAAMIFAPTLALGNTGGTDSATESAASAAILPASAGSIEIIAEDIVAEDLGDAAPAADDSAVAMVRELQRKAEAEKRALSTAAEPKPVPAAPAKKPRASSLSAQVAQMGAPAALDAELQCLAGAVYFESKGESLNGQLAVAHVVINRAKSGRFPSTLCGVVYQRSQFSFVRGGRMPSINTGSQDWREAVAIARIARDGIWESPVGKALFFHATHVSPGWKLTRVGKIDNHIFYR